ncbi:MAG: hypothetical protein CME70_04495 [Halobacteriovorax sp.]|nr:hypothetical protein [Halobacteriovorax sp.]|tara:strand:- start:8892 stop:9482 length:591 start_codon:yes stop_codon:yes gene_type:complete
MLKWSLTLAIITTSILIFSTKNDADSFKKTETISKNIPLTNLEAQPTDSKTQTNSFLDDIPLEEPFQKRTHIKSLIQEYCRQEKFKAEEKKDCEFLLEQNQNEIQALISKEYTSIQSYGRLIIYKALEREMGSKTMAKAMMKVIEKLHPESKDILIEAAVDITFKKLKEGYRVSDLDFKDIFLKENPFVRELVESN